MQSRCSLTLLTVFVVGANTLHAADAPSKDKRTVDFQKDIAPILRQSCVDCHSSVLQLAGLRLDRRDLAMKGSDTGKVILPGRGEESMLIRRLVDKEAGLIMPPTFPFFPGEKVGLPAEQIELLKAWIDAGAEWPEGVTIGPEAGAGGANRRLAALKGAIRTGDPKAVGAILEEKSLVNAADIDGTTPLIHAALYADADVVGLLIDRGADVNLPTKDGMTALMAAAGDLDKVRLLLERGAKIAATTKSGRTPLLIAATYPGNVEVVRLLLKNGALATEQDSVKETPLTSASKRGDVAMAEVLIAAGAKLNAGGRPPLVWAAEEGSAEMVACLLKHGAGKVPKIVNAALFSAVVRGPLDSVRMLLEAGADVNAASGFAGYTPLMGAAYSEVARPELIALLLEKRADATARTEAGVTSLALARKRGHTKIVDLLTKAGATE